MRSRDRAGRALPGLLVVGSMGLATALALGPIAWSLGMPGGGPAGDLWRLLEPGTPVESLFVDPTAESDAQLPGRQSDGTVVLEDGVSEYRVLDERVADDGTSAPLTWSSCHPIRYVVDTRGAPRTFEQDVRLVMAELRKVTGLELVDAGVEGEEVEWLDPQGASRKTRWWSDDRWASILVRWTDAEDEWQLRGDVVGLATGWTGLDEQGTEFWTRAVVDLDREMVAWGSWEGTGEYLPVLRHEMGHVLGLDHVDDPMEIMHPDSAAAWTFSPGDLAGLGALSHGPCAVEGER